MGSGWQPGSGLNVGERVGKMVDTLQAVAAWDKISPWLRAEFNNQLATPQAICETVAQRQVRLKIGNISLRQNAVGDIVIENSLHRFYHGHNGGSFPRAEVAAAIQKLSATLGFDVSLCELRRVDIGANLTGLDVQATLQALTDYKGKRFLKYERGKGITGAKRLLTELEVKLYDKQRELADKRQATLPTATLRYELTSRKLSYLRKLGAVKVADLASPEFFTAASQELEARLSACGFAEQFSPDLLSADELEALALVSSPLFAAYAANRANKDRATRRRKLATQAREKALLASPKADLLARLKATLTELA